MPPKKKSVKTGKKIKTPFGHKLEEPELAIEQEENSLDLNDDNSTVVDSTDSPSEKVGDENGSERETISGDAETPAAPETTQVKEAPSPLGPKERYFEAPDGRIYKGPIDAPSIPDPITGKEINPMRGPSPRLHR